MENEHEDKRIVKIVTITMASMFLVVVLLILSSIFLPMFLDGLGRKLRASLSWEGMAAELLREKYGEEFIIRNVWSKASHEFYADCSPVSNEEVVFEAVLWNDGGGIEYDEYIQGVISRKISERFQKELEQIFDDCYVYTFIPYAAGVEFDNVPETTIEQYVEKYREKHGEHSGSGRWVVYVFINLEREQEGDVEREYEYFSQVGLEIIEKQMPDIYFELYGVDEETKNWCENYFSIKSGARGEFSSMKAKNPCLSIRYMEGEITKTFEEYKEYKELRSSLLKVNAP